MGAVDEALLLQLDRLLSAPLYHTPIGERRSFDAGYQVIRAALYDAMQVNRVIKTPSGEGMKLSDEKGLSREPAKGADAVPREPTDAMRKAVRAYYGPGAYEIECCGELWVVMYDEAVLESRRASPAEGEATTGRALTPDEMDELRMLRSWAPRNASQETRFIELQIRNAELTASYAGSLYKSLAAANASLRAKLAEFVDSKDLSALLEVWKNARFQKESAQAASQPSNPT